MIRTRNRTVYLKPKDPNFGSTIKDYIDHPQRVYTNDTAVLNKENGFSEVQISMLVTKKGERGDIKCSSTGHCEHEQTIPLANTKK